MMMIIDNDDDDDAGDFEGEDDFQGDFIKGWRFQPQVSKLFAGDLPNSAVENLEYIAN